MRTNGDNTVYLVLDGFGKLGRAYVETDERDADKETVVDNMITGKYNRPLRVVAFNIVEGWSRDASKDIACSVMQRAHRVGIKSSEGAMTFLETFDIAG